MHKFDDEQLLAYFADNGLTYESVQAMKDAFRFCHHRDGFLVIQLQPYVCEIDKRDWFRKPVNRSMFGLIYTHHYFGHVLPMKDIRWQESISRFEIRIGTDNVAKFERAFDAAMEERRAKDESENVNDGAQVETPSLETCVFKVHVITDNGRVSDTVFTLPPGGWIEVTNVTSSKTSVVYTSKKRKREEKTDDVPIHAQKK